MQNLSTFLRPHVFSTLFCFFMHNSLTAQMEIPCGNIEAIDTSELNYSRPGQPCFDLDDVISNCTPIYLRVNFHLFVGDDCTGAFDPNHITSALPQEAAFYEASQPGNRGIPERMIYEMNQLVINNHPQKLENGEYDSLAPCVPLRFVLGDVNIHCDYAFRSQGNFSNFFLTADTSFSQYEKPGINVYYVKPDGNFSGQGDITTSGVLIGYPDASLTLHEIGHCLNLFHTFLGADGCPDTPGEGVDWDRNCDGDTQDNNERDWPCWKHYRRIMHGVREPTKIALLQNLLLHLLFTRPVATLITCIIMSWDIMQTKML